MALGTAILLGVVLGGLIVLTLIGGGFKLWLNKRKLKRDTERGHLEAARKANQEKTKRPVGEGDLFGVKAIQHGYFGGVAQSRPASPAPSYILAPGQTLVDWSKPGSANSSVVDLPRFPDSRSASTTSLNQGQKPSPLRLQPPDHLNRKTLDPSIGVGGAYMPPLATPREHRASSPFGAPKPAGWVAPLDVHFSRPSTPQSQPTARPTSYLPKLNFPTELGKTGLLVPTPAGSLGGVKSEEASIVSTEITVPAAVKGADPSPSPTVSIYPQSRKARQANKSYFGSSADERPSSRRSNKSFNSSKSPRFENFPDLPVPLKDLPPQVPAIDPLNFPFDNREWNTGTAVIRDSIVSKHRVSLFQPSLDPQDNSSRHSRIQSIAASSIYSARTSIVDPNTSSDQFNLTIPGLPKDTPQPLAPSRPYVPQIPPRSRARSRSNSTSTSRNRSTSAGLSRSHDSIRLQHSRTISHSSTRSSDSKRCSKDRDTLHFDPSSTHRNRSGSITGRKVDFDHPRESPFSNSNSIANSQHSSNSSISSVSSSDSEGSSTSPQRNGGGQTRGLDVPQLPAFDPTRLSVAASFQGKGKDRPASEVSQGSIGDFYDSYYRQSTIQGPTKRQSKVLEQAKAIENARQRNGSFGNGVRRPPPLRLGLNVGSGASAGGLGVEETIVEMPTPAVSAVQERFPKMVSGRMV